MLEASENGRGFLQGLGLRFDHVPMAGIDFDYRDRCRRGCAVYFLSRVKEEIGVMVFEWIVDDPGDMSGFRHYGVLLDWKVRSPQDHVLRLIMYQDALTGDIYEFLTSEPDLPPGVISELYRRRWETEKVFAEVKTQLGQKKVWGHTGGQGGRSADDCHDS